MKLFWKLKIYIFLLFLKKKSFFVLGVVQEDPIFAQVGLENSNF